MVFGLNGKPSNPPKTTGKTSSYASEARHRLDLCQESLTVWLLIPIIHVDRAAAAGHARPGTVDCRLVLFCARNITEAL